MKITETALASVRRRACAKFILDAALKLGIHIGARDAEDIILVAPMRVPRDVRRQFERAIYELRLEVFEVIREKEELS
jgi:hypothetical protein